MRGLAALVALGAALLVAPAAKAEATNCGTFSRPSVVLRVYAIRGVSCATALRVAKRDAAGGAPAPWRCAVSSGAERYHGRPVYSKCGYGGGGSLLKRHHAFVVVQRNSAATG